MKCNSCIHSHVCEDHNHDVWNPFDNCQNYDANRQHGDWEYLKEHITDMRNADGKLNQKETCQFILNLMGVIEKEGGAE